MTQRAIPAHEVFAKLPAHVREAGEARGRELVQEYTLRQVREAVSLTQAAVAKAAHTTQDQVSKIERREDLMVSTLEKHIAALGGTLRISVDIPGRPPIPLSLKGGKPVVTPAPRQGRKTAPA
jgi:DNA-binding XRE family transcriptional regulator